MERHLSDPPERPGVTRFRFGPSWQRLLSGCCSVQWNGKNGRKAEGPLSDHEHAPTSLAFKTRWQIGGEG
jgi:hypothetical protein